MCGAVIFRKFRVFLTRACRAAVAFSSKCRWHFKLGTQRIDLDIRNKLRMKNHGNFDVSSRNSKNARKAPPAHDRYWRVAHNEDPSLNPHATPNLCRKQLRTFSNASRCVYGRKISKTIENYRKIVKIDEIWHAEKIKFRTVKVADFLQTVSPRCREWFPRVKSWGMGRVPIPNQKLESTPNMWPLMCIMVTFLEFLWKWIDYTLAKYAQNVSKSVKNVY